MTFNTKSLRILTFFGLWFGLIAFVKGQLHDVTRTPNTENVGIKKSLGEQIGSGRGDLLTPGSSQFIIARDPFRAVSRGQKLFQRKFALGQGFGPLTGDGAGDIENDASIGAGLVDSCAGCHARPRGSAGFGGDVFTRPDSRDAPHLFGLGLVEMLADEITSKLRAIRAEAIADAEKKGRSVRRRLVIDVGPATDGDDDDDANVQIDYGQIRAFPDGSVDTSQVEGVNPDLRVRPFFAQGGLISMREFIVGALNDEMGLEAIDPDLLAASSGGTVTTPSGMVLDGSVDPILGPFVIDASDDADGDGVLNEIPTSLVDFFEFYLLNYFKPGTYVPSTRMKRENDKGERLFNKIGCASCHIADLTIEHDRRVADVETNYDAVNGIFNNFFAVAIPLFKEIDDPSGFPTQKVPLGEEFLVENIYADFKRHDLGPNFWERNFDGTLTREFMTEPLWGVGSTAPYGHDGRSINLREVILRHGGEAQRPRNKFARLNETSKRRVIQFLQSLVLFGPPDTASNLNPGDPANPDFPQRGHGSVDISVLFNDPSDKE